MTAAREEWRSLVTKRMCHAAAPGSERYWCPELECGSRAEIEGLQSEKVASAYRLLWAHSSFYRRKFLDAGLSPASVGGLEDLARIPLTYQEEWAADEEAHPPWGSFSPLSHEEWLTRGWMLFATSGTKSSFPRVFRHTIFDRDQWAWQGARALYAMGVRRGDVALSCFGYGPSVAFWGLHNALNLMGVPVIPGGGASTERRCLFVERYRPTVLLGTPSYILHLGREMEAAGLDPRGSEIRRLVLAGEPGAAVPATKRRLEQLWGARAYDDFGCTEVAMSPLGYECAEQAENSEVEVHLMEDQYVVEVLDPDNFEPVRPGHVGVLVVSNLYSEAQPILRYVMGDLVRLTRGSCSCGRTHARAIGGLLGRADDLVTIRGLQFFPSAIEDAVRALPGVSDEFRIEVTRERELDQMRIIIEPAGACNNDFNDALSRRLQAALGISVEVLLVPAGSMPRTQAKAKRLLDLRRVGSS
jgi:phenylacetate-CoA ligase